MKNSLASVLNGKRKKFKAGYFFRSYMLKNIRFISKITVEKINFRI